MSVITGDAVPAVRDMEDKEVVDECMKVLRELFKEQVTLSQIVLGTKLIAKSPFLNSFGKKKSSCCCL